MQRNMLRNIRWDAIDWMRCGKVEIEGSVKRLLYRVRKDKVHQVINHGNLHFRFEYAFVKRKTKWDNTPHLRKLVSLLQSRSSLVKGLTYPYYDDQYYWFGLLPIPETTFDCNESLWKKMNEALFESGKVNVIS